MLLTLGLSILSSQKKTPHVPVSYYVSTTGSDSNNGLSTGAPFLTIQKGLDSLLAGDTLYIRGGTYTAGGSKRLMGSASKRITVRNYASEVVIIDTSVIVTGWVAEGGNKYHSSNTQLGSSFNTTAYALWKGNVVSQRASTVAVEGDVKITNAGSGNFTFQIYSTTDPSLSTYKVAGTGGTNSQVGLSLRGDYFDVSGIITNYCYMGFMIGGTSGVSSSNFTYTNCQASYSVTRGFNLSQGPTFPITRGTFTGCIADHTKSSWVEDTSQHGFKFSADVDLTINGTYITVDNCQSYSNGYHGFQCSEGWDACTIKNSTAHDNGLRADLTQKLDSADIRMALSSSAAARIGHTCFGNTTYNTNYGIYLGGTIQNSVFYGNTCRNAVVAGMYIDDFSSTTLLGTDNIIYNNIVRDSPYGIIIDTATTTAKVYNNTIDNCSAAGIVITSSNIDADIRNNAIASPTLANPLFQAIKVSQDLVTVPNSNTANALFGATSYSFEWLGQLNYGTEPSLLKTSNITLLKKGSSNQTGFTLDLIGGNALRLTYTTSGFSILYTITSTTITLGASLHIVGTWTKTQAWKLYINGTEASYSLANALTTPGNDTPSLLRIGNNVSNGISGTISRVRIYRNVNLSAANVTTLFGGGSVAGFTGEYLFTDGSGSTLTDSSGNGNHGTITGATWSGASLVYGTPQTLQMTSVNYNAYYSPDASPFHYSGSNYNFANYKAASTYDANSINVNFTGEFTNYAGNDFSIGASATNLKNAGTTIAQVPNDYLLVARPVGAAYSIGAYEA